jgi:hypothetical protein
MRVLKLFLILVSIVTFSSTVYSKELKKEITVRVDGLNLFYTEKSTLDKKGFDLEKNSYLKDRGSYRLMVVNRFKKKYLKESFVKAEGWKDVVFCDEKQTLTIQCTVRGAVTETIGENVADFEWLLEPYSMDLFCFKKTSPKELSGYKKVNDTPNTFVLRFPSSIIGHCYFHVWHK